MLFRRLTQRKKKQALSGPTLQVFFGDRETAELEKREGQYVFHYLDAFRDLDLSPFPGFPDVDSTKRYFSEQLFPFFRERIPDRTRPEIQELIKRLGVPEEDDFRLLAELSRRSVTDPFELKMTATGDRA